MKKFITDKKKENVDTFFILKNIDIQYINKTYNLLAISEIHNEKIDLSKDFDESGRINLDLLKNKPMETVINNERLSFLTFVNLNYLGKTGFNKIPCFNCHRKFTNYPLIVPIEYHCILDKTTNKSIHNFNGDAVVCSFNCAVSHIYNNNTGIYKDSLVLLYKLYLYVFGKYPEHKIIPSPHFSLRTEYGGPINDEEYEKGLQLLHIIDTQQVRLNIISRIFEAIKN